MTKNQSVMARKVKKHKKTHIKRNKLGVKNSLVNNINARKNKGKSRAKRQSKISKKSFADIQNNWGKKKDNAKKI